MLSQHLNPAPLPGCLLLDASRLVLQSLSGCENVYSQPLAKALASASAPNSAFRK
jgi:hypothetical protein